MALAANLILIVAGLILARNLFTRLLKWIVWHRRIRKAMENVPGPPALPLIGSAHTFKPDSLGFTYQLEEFMADYVYKDPKKPSGMICIWVGPQPMICLSTCDAIRPLLESNTELSKSAHYDLFKKWVGYGLATSEGEKWQRRRKMITPTFHFAVLNGYSPTFFKYADELVRLVTPMADQPEGFDIFPVIRACALSMICETAMNTSVHQSEDRRTKAYINTVHRVNQLIWDHERKPWLWLDAIWYLTGLGGEFDACAQRTQDFSRTVIAERKRQKIEQLRSTIGDSPGNEDESGTKKKTIFLDMLLKMQDEHGLSDDDIREEVDIFMAAGHDTTTASTSFTLWFIGQNADVQAKVHAELDQVFGDDTARSATLDDIRQLTYLEQCIKEALRLAPPVPLISRQLNEDMTIENVLLPAGTTLLVLPYAAHRDPRHYARPLVYDPDHFSAEAAARRDPYAFIPFSAGARNCIGQKFALLEEKCVLAALLRQFRVESLDVGAWDNRPVIELGLKPNKGVKVRLHSRTAAVAAKAA